VVRQPGAVHAERIQDVPVVRLVQGPPGDRLDAQPGDDETRVPVRPTGPGSDAAASRRAVEKK
jgi:hypothetical protein